MRPVLGELFLVSFKVSTGSSGDPSASIYLRSTPHPVTVTTRIITFLVGNPHKPLFVTVTGWGLDPKYIPVACVSCFQRIGADAFTTFSAFEVAGGNHF